MSVWIRKGHPAVVLAPMEGVTDAPMRALLTELGGLDYCVSEFLRVSQDIPPARVFYRHIPELACGSRTPAGVPVQVQILGGDPEKVAATASLACELGSPGVDLNFGCPAPTVNRHDGGATLLKHPQRLREIVAAVRRAVPAHLPVSAKLRLGWDSPDPVHENAEQAADGGADWVTIHGRTKVQGYAPPVLWKPIGEVRRRLSIPVVANGDIWTLEDLERCQEETGCEHFMFGRGALADPTLPTRAARWLSADLSTASEPLETPSEWRPLLERFITLSLNHPHRSDGYEIRRVKQWMRMVHLRRPLPWFEELKRLPSMDAIMGLMSAAN